MDPLAHTLALLAMAVATSAIDIVPLDMAPNSFDDQYEGCRPAMAEALPALNRSDVQHNEKFARVWQKATAEWRRRGSPVSPLSSPAQAIALMAYTMGDLYEEFNAAVRTAGRSRQEYRDNFHFKTLHFLLTDVLATLRGRQGELCRCASRQVDRVRFEAQPGQRIRFGHFMSMSSCKGGSIGVETQTVLSMVSCQGVDIKQFSFSPDKDEVLIPPFETFEVTDVTENMGKVAIMLDLTKTHSNYNCEWLRGGSIARDPTPLGGLLLATAALVVATGTL